MSQPLLDLPFPALERLLGSISAREFFDRFWEKAPGLLNPLTDAERADFLRADWRALALAARAQNEGSVELLKGGRPTKCPTEDALDEGFNEGGSVRIFKVLRVWPELARLCSDLQWEFGFKVGANLYVTPEGRQGLDVHADSHDVIVVQMAGKKDWEIYGSPYPLPVEYRTPMVFEEGPRMDHRGDEFGGRSYKNHDLGAPLIRCTLAPGDLLYVPRGFVHQAVASHGTSVHVTIGIHATTWADLLALAVAQESRSEPRLRETLPPGATRVAAPQGFVDRELRERGGRLFDRMHGEALMLETASRFTVASAAGTAAPSSAAGSSPGTEEHAETPAHQSVAAAESSLDPNARYSLAPHAYVSVHPQGINLRSLKRPAMVQCFPFAFKPVFDRLIRGEALSTADASPLTPRSAEVFLSRLLKEGALIQAAPR